MDLSIPFPLLGINKFYSNTAQSSETTPHAINVFPIDVLESRMRGGSRFGFVKRFTTNLSGTPKAMLVVTKITSEFDNPYEFLVIAMDDGVFISRVVRDEGPPVSYTETISGLSGAILDENGLPVLDENGLPITSPSLVQVTADGEVTQFQGKVFFAQSGETAIEGNGVVTNGVLTSSSIIDWNQYGIQPYSHAVTILTSDNIDFVARSYNINTVLQSSVDLDTGVSDSTSVVANVFFRVIFAPVLLDLITRTFSPVPLTAGSVPEHPQVVVQYRGRLVWATDSRWVMSRVGDGGDYNFGADVGDASRAIAGVSSDAGEPADPIVALAPVGYDFLVMFSDQSTWILRGDPGFGGQLYNLSRNIGCVSSQAWTYGRNGEIFFLSKDGLYRMDAGAETPPVSLSDERMPNELKELTRDNFDTSLVYDLPRNAIGIFVTPSDGSAGTHWWFDIRTESFWKFSFAVDGKQPVAAVAYSGAPTRQRRLTVVAADGYVREMSGSSDDGDAIASEIIFGPIRITNTIRLEGILNEIHAELGTGSEPTTLEVYSGGSAQEVVTAAIAGVGKKVSVTITNGRSATLRPRLRAGYICIRLASSLEWSMESLEATVEMAGDKRT